ncbi:MAG TPA: hypothetical protein VKR42_10965 [Ktedonobacteraceae bacterium]|nr:hypothetical protein [Ktedonobacteraceae bacterium]
MATLEERLAMLEESFGTMQREVGKSIHVLNENTTILLGLFQTQLQETKQTRVSVEFMKIRMDMLETKVNANTALLNEHTTRFDRLEGMLTQVLARLPEKP